MFSGTGSGVKVISVELKDDSHSVLNFLEK